MLGLFLFVILLSFAVAGICRFVFPEKFNVTETCLIVGIATVVGGLSLLIMQWSNTADFDILNGQVTGKEMVRVSCSHSYSCHCHTVSTGYGKSRSSHTECDTCYEHLYDQDWDVNSTIGDFTINRVDRQGLDEPRRWSIIKKGDPTARTETVTNYVRAAPQSLFNMKSFDNDNAMFGKWLPNYPEIYDYYKFDHAINTGVKGLNVKDYNVALADILRNIGPKKQANVIVVFVPTSDRAYLNALERHWIGSKKNDIVVAIGITNYPKIDWAGAFTFGKSVKNELLIVKMRNTIETVGDASKVNDIVSQIRINAEYYYNRQAMSNYEYLKHDYFPSTKALVIAGILYLIILIGMLAVFWIHDIGGSGVATNRFSRYNNNRW